MSKKVTLSADKATATVAEAKGMDIVTTVFDQDTCLTGTYGFFQKAALVGLGMAIQNNRLGRGWNPISAS